MSRTLRLERQLGSALRSLEPDSLPARTRLRIADDLRVPARRDQRAHAAMRALSAAASIAILLLWAGLILAIASSVTSAPAASPSPHDVLPTPEDLPQLPEWPVLWDPFALAVIAAIGLFVGAAATTSWIRTRLAGLVRSAAAGAAPVTVRAMPRRPGQVSKLALFLAALPASYLITQPYVDHPFMPEYSVQIFLSASLGWAAALRYPWSDRSARWLIVGGTIVAVGRAFFLDAYAYMQATGWALIAVGLVRRAGIVPRPRWFVVAGVVAIALWAEADSATEALSHIGGTSDWNPQAQLFTVAALRACALVALTTAAWAAWKGWRRARSWTWLLTFLGIAGLLGIEIYTAQIYWLAMRIWDTGLLGPEELFAWREYYASSIFSALVLLGFLGGLKAVDPATATARNEDAAD